MLHNKDIVNSLPMLAAVLGDQFGVTVQIGGDSAFTTGKTIYLPDMPLELDAETMALARGYLDHEAAHVRHTDFAALRAANLDSLTHSFWNCIEDWRIEKELSRIFPGCRYHFIWMIRHFFLRKYRPAKEHVEAVVNYVLCTVRAWDVPELNDNVMCCRKGCEQHYPGIADRIDEILGRCHAYCPDTQAAIDYARELRACIEAYANEQQEDQEQDSESVDLDDEDGERDEAGDEQGTGSDTVQSNSRSSNLDTTQSSNELQLQDEQCANAYSAEQGQSGYVPDEQDNVQTGTDDEYDAHSQAKSTASSEAIKEVPNASPSPQSAAKPSINQSTQELLSLLNSSPDTLPPDLTTQAAQELKASVPQQQEQRLTVARVQTNSFDRPLPDTVRKSALQSSIALRSKLQGLLQAHTYARRTLSRHGKLDTGQLHNIAVGQQKVFRREGRARAVHTAVHILLDTSGSMGGTSLDLALQACYALTYALQGIPHVQSAVTAFPGLGKDDTVLPILLHGKRLSPQTPFGLGATGNTPLAPALLWALQNMLRVQEDRRIVLVLTDGMPDSVPATVYALKLAEKLGVEVMGIGIMDNSITQFMPRTSCVISALGDLAPMMFGMMQKALLQQ